MPHYKDGTLAHVGDQVRGASYNRGGREEIGVLVAITSQGDVCNAKIYFPFKTINASTERPVAGTDYVNEGIDYAEIRVFEKVTEDASVAPPV